MKHLRSWFPLAHSGAERPVYTTDMLYPRGEKWTRKLSRLAQLLSIWLLNLQSLEGDATQSRRTRSPSATGRRCRTSVRRIERTRLHHELGLSLRTLRALDVLSSGKAGLRHAVQEEVNFYGQHGVKPNKVAAKRLMAAIKKLNSQIEDIDGVVNSRAGRGPVRKAPVAKRSKAAKKTAPKKVRKASSHDQLSKERRSPHSNYDSSHLNYEWRPFVVIILQNLPLPCLRAAGVSPTS